MSTPSLHAHSACSKIQNESFCVCVLQGTLKTPILHANTDQLEKFVDSEINHLIEWQRIHWKLFRYKRDYLVRVCMCGHFDLYHGFSSSTIYPQNKEYLHRKYRFKSKMMNCVVIVETRSNVNSLGSPKLDTHTETNAAPTSWRSISSIIPSYPVLKFNGIYRQINWY